MPLATRLSLLRPSSAILSNAAALAAVAADPAADRMRSPTGASASISRCERGINAPGDHAQGDPADQGCQRVLLDPGGSSLAYVRSGRRARSNKHAPSFRAQPRRQPQSCPASRDRRTTSSPSWSPTLLRHSSSLSHRHHRRPIWPRSNGSIPHPHPYPTYACPCSSLYPPEGRGHRPHDFSPCSRRVSSDRRAASPHARSVCAGISAAAAVPAAVVAIGCARAVSALRSASSSPVTRTFSPRIVGESLRGEPRLDLLARLDCPCPSARDL